MTSLPASFRDSPQALPKREADELYAQFTSEIAAIPETYTPILTHQLDAQLQQERENEEQDRTQVAKLWAECLRKELDEKKRERGVAGRPGKIRKVDEDAHREIDEAEIKESVGVSASEEDEQSSAEQSDGETSDDDVNEIELLRKTVQEKVKQAQKKLETEQQEPDIDSDDEGGGMFIYPR